MRGIVLGNCLEPVIRTYNYKRGMVTDHRSGISVNLKDVLAGRVQPFIEAMIRRVPKSPSPIPPPDLANKP